jgi:phospholipid/cholesterol/gamma-HCH transport system substrate-binding protein
MEREANYAAVGAFVLLAALAAAVFVYWYSDTREHRDFNRYEIYFTGSVSGLDRGGAVRYLGVGVGRVYALRIDPRDSGRVEVVVDIDSTTPISSNTVAELQLQGVTGLLYIDLMDDPGNKRAAPAVPSLKYPVIRASPSRFDLFLASLPELVAGANDVVQRVQRVFDEKNLRAINTLLANLETTGRGLPKTAHNVDALVDELRAATAQLTSTARSANELLASARPEVTQTTQQLRQVADHLVTASAALDQILSENRADIRSFARDGLPEIERFVREGRAAAEDVRALADSLRENPAQLLYEPPPRGVEIPK